MMRLEDQIRLRAFHLWKAAGEPSGSRDCFWYQAEKEILAEHTALETGGFELAGDHANQGAIGQPRLLS